MKGIDPHLIRLGILALMFIGRLVISSNRKQARKNNALRPPQSAPPPPPIASPGQLKNDPMPKQKPSADSPWTNSKGPFD